MIQLQPATDWPVPYIARATIGAGPAKGRCGHCRRLRPIYFFDFVRNWGADCQGIHDMQCDTCIDQFLRECTDKRSVIKDERTQEKMKSTENILNNALALTTLCLKFGRVERVTKHEDGARPETDTDHTVMLGVMACAFAAQYQPDLDLGKIAQYALVHDLVEAYAGDTDTSQVLNANDKEVKAQRELQAYERIKREFKAEFRWLPIMIGFYDLQADREARYVKAFDKVLPKLTHVLNNCAVVRGTNYNFYHEEQRRLMHKLVGDMPWLIELWEQSVAEVVAVAGNL